MAYSLLYNGTQSEIFGGDYISIATQMNNFFNTLLKAGINPLVVLDGITPAIGKTRNSGIPDVLLTHEKNFTAVIIGFIRIRCYDVW